MSETLQRHPLSAAFPDMGPDEFVALCRDIEANGVLNPIVLYQGMVLDGWHRYQAALQCEEAFKVVAYEGDDPQSWVISQNAHRRHITASQLAVAVASVAAWAPEGRPKNNSATAAELSEAPKTATELAALAGVGLRTIERAKTAITAGLGEDVKAGRISVDKAERIARLPEEQRAAAVADPKLVRKPSKPITPAQDPDQPSPLEIERDVLDAQVKDLTIEVDRLRRGLLLDLMGEPQDARQEWEVMIDGYKARIHALESELTVTRATRDQLMRENSEMKKAMRGYERRLSKVAA